MTGFSGSRVGAGAGDGNAAMRTALARRIGIVSDHVASGDPAIPSLGTDADPLAALCRSGLQDLSAPRGAHATLALHALGRAGGPVVWVQDALSRLEFGAPYARGLDAAGLDPSRVIAVRAPRPRDVLWTMEEASRAGIPVVGEIEGDPRALDFTATRRLEMRARAAAVTCVLVRVGRRAGSGSSAAHWRWRVLPHPSASDPFDARAPGAARWELSLLRARTRPPGRWIVEGPPAWTEAREETRGEARGERTHERRDGSAHRLRVVAALADGDVAPRVAPGEAGAGGRVALFRPAPRAGHAA